LGKAYTYLRKMQMVSPMSMGPNMGSGPVQGREPMCTLFVTGLPQDVKEREIRNMFRFYTGFVGCSLQTKRTTREDTANPPAAEQEYQLAFLLFDSEASALEAQSLLSGTKFDYHSPEAPLLKVQIAKKNLGLSSHYWASESPRVNNGAVGGVSAALDPYTGQLTYQATPVGVGGYGQASPMGAPIARKPKRKPSDAATPSTTLFVTNLAAAVDDEVIKNVFKVQAGFSDVFVSVRNGRRFCFVEFQSETYSTAAFNNLNGWLLIPNDAESGLKIAYSTTPFRQPKTSRA